jgi:hypothetical protein
VTYTALDANMTHICLVPKNVSLGVRFPKTVWCHGGRKESSKIVKVSWVEEARQEAQKRKASRSNMSFEKGPCHAVGFVSVTEVAGNREMGVQL